MSAQEVDIVPGGALDCVGKLDLTGNFCADQLRRNNDDTVDGDTIFVRTDCETRMPLDPSKQDPVFRKPGVPLDRGMAEAFAQAWASADIITASAGEDNKCGNADDSPLISDCTHAMSSLLAAPGDTVSRGKKGGTWWAGVSVSGQGFNGRKLTRLQYAHSCAIAVQYDADWNDGCSATLADVALNAHSVLGYCDEEGSPKVAGQRPFQSGECASRIEILGTGG